MLNANLWKELIIPDLIQVLRAAMAYGLGILWRTEGWGTLYNKKNSSILSTKLSMFKTLLTSFMITRCLQLCLSFTRRNYRIKWHVLRNQQLRRYLRKIIFSQWHQNKQNQVHIDLDKDLVATDSTANEEGHQGQ